ncbi:Hpt domain-containing protein [Achromobacter pestifer]|uniref:Hpt domain-containing protein n=1 Tax=Achromobacter pestifer TaxID=1353889 RepID=A0A7D4ILP4_9BURK|nr:Hpt domain-containing protein [Achromobacter pestifer]QKH36244.1 Hpt domain-containing protein [Achromobacter pestifer]
MKNPAAPALYPVQEASQAQAVAALRGELLAKVGNDLDIAAELALSLHLNHREDVSALLLAIKQERWTEVRRYAHRILNTAQLLGCGALVGLCVQVEEMLAREAGQTRAELLADYVQVVENLSVVLERVNRTF